MHGRLGDRGGVGVPMGHRFCADTVVGYWRKRTPEHPPGSTGIPPGGHTIAWPDIRPDEVARLKSINPVPGTSSVALPYEVPDRRGLTA
jgi:hypothetical protein